MAINVNEATRILAYLSSQDPLTEEWAGVANATNKSCTVYRPDGSTLSSGSNAQVQYLGLTEDGEAAIYAYTCTPDLGGVYRAAFSMQDPAGNQITETAKFYVHG